MRIGSYCVLSFLALSLLAMALSLAGVWKNAGNLASALFGITMVLALLDIVKNSDQRVT
jgi:uncharacterized membrane protein YtjA (UPF0391 family)